ncbi:AraC family transcriptional regulator [Pyxidicoccus caerfyrddinensis]|uniref:AraC family transcriptional regulator n=1 Tax=Pyxidicoccus caerfyrddinensis TaxID=2709663 RepID=UPI0013DD001F|nr:AraC family transcriptional regulator [Pyxidicoccus caerfyrddinensis]
MRTQEQAAPPFIRGNPLPASPRDESRARLGLRVDLRTTPPGTVSFEALPDHRLKVHAGAPVRGACRTQRFVYTRGDIDIFPAGQSDVWEEETANTSLVVRLAPALLRRAAEDMGLNPDHAGLEPRHHFRDSRIEHIAWALESEREEGHPGGLLYTESLGLALAFHLLGRYPAPLAGVRGLSGPQLKRVTEYIEEHLDRNLSLARLAGITGVSESHFRALFKRSTGLPVHEYVVQRRVERARTLLLRGDLPASQVALEAGFSHQSHMARCMRRVLGVTPSSLVRGARAR